MLHKALKAYLSDIEQAVIGCDAYVEHYREEILTPERINLRIRLRFDNGCLLEIGEAVVVEHGRLEHLDYRYHCQDDNNRLLFRYDSTPHFPQMVSFPHHKHLATEVIESKRPAIPHVTEEAVIEARQF